MTGEPGPVAARSFYPDPAYRTPRLHPSDHAPIPGGVRRELIGSQQPACAIHHRRDMGIPMRVYPANYNPLIGSNLL